MKYALAFLVIIALTACTPAIVPFKWLEGTWEMPTKRGYLYEKWEFSDGKRMSGESYRISDGERIPLESLKIQWEGGDFWYVPTVFDQNEGKPVKFKLTATEDGRKFTFENPEHDFPQRIIYEFRPIEEGRKSKGDTLVASISGERNGQSRASEFLFLRKED